MAQTAKSEAVQLEPVVISVQRGPEAAFEAPAAISVVGRDAIANGGLQVNLSESLVRVPGITVLNRQNYAQDLQLSIRGFGSRSTFGIRGVRLIIDGIPATMPDGQGQASSISLGSTGRIEVLRGPLAQLYGNAAGGVVQVFTEPDALRPTFTLTGGFGRFGQSRLGLKFSTTTEGGQGITVDASQFQTDGYRQHSETRRGQLNARWQTEIGRDTNLSVVLNALDQPLSKDPLGLTREQFTQDPRQTQPIGLAQDARKTVRQNQIGMVVDHRLDDRTTLTARLYAGARNLDSALSIPLGAQQSATSSGGIVSFDRRYGGLGLQFSHRVALDSNRSLKLLGGFEFDRSIDDRKGFINDRGRSGALKRDERNQVANRDFFVQARVDLSKAWTATAGVRNSQVSFTSEDRFVDLARGNPNDSGDLQYSATNPVVGLSWRANADLNLYANTGRGFETPTFTELAYRANGTGLNTDLRAARSSHAEIGAKYRLGAGHRMDLALFDVRTSDEIVVDTNSGGRSTFKNAGRTRRSGVEMAYVGQLTDSLRVSLSLTTLRARTTESLVSGSGAAASIIAAGSRLPGAPERSAFAELAWAPKAAWGGFNAAVELVHTGRLIVNDENSDAAPSATVFNLRSGFNQQLGAWRLSQLFRIDNLADKAYAGSVIVNEGNRRYFEPALPRAWLFTLSAQRVFE